MKRLLILILCLLFCEEGFSQNILCVDTITTTGFFYRIKYKGVKGFDTPMLTESCYILEASAYNTSIDILYSKARLQHTDTIKYITCAPKLDAYLRKGLTKICENEYSRNVCISDSITPLVYTHVKGINKFDRKTMIGFSKAKIVWLQLSVLDFTAFRNFNTPYSLMPAHVRSKFYQIYIPISVVTLDNKVFVKNQKIIIDQL